MGKLDPATRIWQVEVPVPSDVKDQLVVSVRATTATGTTFCNTGSITVPAQGNATPYPSHVTVSGVSSP